MISLLSILVSLTVPVANARPPLVFIHGIKGSVLETEQSATVWLNGAQALGLKTPDLRLPLSWSGEIQERDHLHAKEPLESVTIIPILAQEKVYGPWMERARKSGRDFYPFVYDWRRDNLESLEAFEKFLDAIVKRHGERAQVVAHSMGGLITLALVHKRPELFSSVIFAGVPFAGGIGFLPDLHVGTAVGQNRSILSPEVLFSFPSVYSLFPLERVRGEGFDIDFFSAKEWRANKLGLFSYPNSEVEKDKLEVFLAQCLTHARAFRERLKPRGMSYPPMTVMLGKETPTLIQMLKAGPKAVRGWDFESAPLVPGDGRVAEQDAVLPKPIPYEKIYSTYKHSELLNDPLIFSILDKK